MTQHLGRACLAEFIGTWFLVAAVCLCAASGNEFTVTGIAATLTVFIYGLGDVSGANFNPAVSLCLGLCGKLPWNRVGLYMITQLFSGLSAGGWARNMCDGDFAAAKIAPLPVEWYLAGAGECLYTAMLCLVVVCVAATKRNQPNYHYGFAIGLTIIAGGHALGKVSGGLLNPAVAIGVLLQDPSNTSEQLAMFPKLALCELVGAVVAYVLYRFIHPEEFAGEGADDNAPAGFVSVLLAECVGTFYLVLTVTLNVLAGAPQAAWSIAASLAAMIYAVGSVSGGHLNPSVTLAIRLRKKSGQYDWVYPIAQIVGGVMASLLGLCLTGTAWGSTAAAQDDKNFPFQIASACELIFTTLLVFTVLSIATVDGKDTQELTGFIVGSCVTVGGYAIGRISGASLNPAVTIGLCSSGLLGTKSPMFYLGFYVCEELFASVVAASLFFVTHQTEVEDCTAECDGCPAGGKAEAPAEALVTGSRSSVAA